MLKKLMKYEITATSRFFLLAYAALIALSILNQLLIGGNSTHFVINEDSFLHSILTFFSVLLYGGVICGIFVGCTLMMVQRFHKNMLGDEGYLMHTLPVRPWQHITAKLLVSAMWLLISIVMMVASISILTWTFPDFPAFFGELTRGVVMAGGSPALFYFETILTILISLVTFMLPFYAAIAIGTFWKKHRIFGAVLAYIGIMAVIHFVVAYAARLWVNIWENNHFSFHDDMITAGGEIAFNGVVSSAVLTGMLLLLAGSAILFFITNFVLERKLNLE